MNKPPGALPCINIHGHKDNARILVPYANRGTSELRSVSNSLQHLARNGDGKSGWRGGIPWRVHFWLHHQQPTFCRWHSHSCRIQQWLTDDGKQHTSRRCLKEEDTCKLRVFEMSILHRISGFSLRERWQKESIKEGLGIDADIVQLVQKRRLMYFGHIMRMDEWRLPYILLTAWKTKQEMAWQHKRRLCWDGIDNYCCY